MIVSFSIRSFLMEDKISVSEILTAVIAIRPVNSKFAGSRIELTSSRS